MRKLSILFIMALLPFAIFCQQITRIEPSNWWTGMKYNTVTILVYGNSIAELTPSFIYNDVELVNTEKVENKNYLFVTIKIGPNAKAGNIQINFSKNSKTVLSKSFPLLKRENGSANRPSFTPKDAIFLIVPDRFSNGDAKNDVISYMNENTVDRNDENKRHGGDIQGIINHLDYIKSLGFTQIWNTPLIENDQPLYSYHGYAATDFYKIDARFGTNEQFKLMVKEANKRGIGVIWDVVLNHCGNQYYFIKDLPLKDWIHYPDSRTRTNHLKTTITDPYATEIDKQEYTDGWFDDHMPDLNQRNPLMAKYLIQNTIWWIEYAGISGLREDTWSYSDKDFLATWSKAILDEYPNMNMTGEEMTKQVYMTSYWQKDKANSDGYQCYLPALMDFSLNDNIISSFNSSNEWFSTWRDTYQSIAQDYLFPHPDNILIFPDNHDVDRFYSRLNKNFANWKLGIAMYMTMRGIPEFLYGTEVLMTNERPGSDGQRRGDFYGGWISDTKDAKTGAGLTSEEKDAQQYFSKLLNWRKTCTAVANGKFKHYAPQKNDVYVYFRYTGNKKVMVVLNKNKETVVLDLKRYEEMIPATFKAKDIVTDEPISVDNTLEVKAKTAMILEIE
ncbi:glycoside hydrolase family 13 protein [Pinibacter aurantiacus]|uniref:Glycoside hydrolase family 13 protein n=1 Tax=Pinibacter aurantiacus TaxID=2851599 RepID=A0A9E2SA00_9BACT|nr:glycoside hydrolase family 13 protein [Pinibacter aurantiacus]MBV4357613.1 glycoside hydrolase family 13 protein [Pinibacter aurantiacus]